MISSSGGHQKQRVRAVGPPGVFGSKMGSEPLPPFTVSALISLASVTKLFTFKSLSWILVGFICLLIKNVGQYVVWNTGNLSNDGEQIG